MCVQTVRSVMWYRHKHQALTFKQNITSVKWKNKEGHWSNKNSSTGVSFVSISRSPRQLNFPGHKTHYNANTVIHVLDKQLSKRSALARGSTGILQIQTLLSKCHVISRYTCHGNLIYAHKNRNAFPRAHSPNLGKLKSIWCRYHTQNVTEIG